MRKCMIFCLLLTTLPIQAATRSDLRTGGKLYKQEKYGQAQAVYNAILQADPHNQEAAIGAGASAYYLKDYAAAESAFKQAAEPDSLRTNDALFNLGNAYYRDKKMTEAKQAYRQVILKNPKDKEALHNLQLILEQEQSPQNNKDKPKDQQQNQGNGQGQNQQNDNNSQGGADNDKQQTSQDQKDAAASVMQMAKDQEHKSYNRQPGNMADDFIEKDW
ncbi:tetratricopeptide repeat protein [Candidatus Avelusimicrobium luingense]|uniref:tetratricopeptide repeat protein n=1 Tax=Candidatus Avelusimicrobium luingense TaxID=3416211 RepID=UPI003D0AABC8